MIGFPARVIRNEEQYEAALDRIGQIFGAEPGTPEGEELDLLLVLIDNYQKKNQQLPKLEPVEIIKFMMEQQGLKQIDLAPYMGGKTRVSEVLNGKRGLTLEMIKNLSAGLHIPVEALI